MTNKLTILSFFAIFVVLGLAVIARGSVPTTQEILSGIGEYEIVLLRLAAAAALTVVCVRAVLEGMTKPRG